MIKPGDLVKLKSEGPVMTAGSYRNNVSVECYWFVGDEVKSNFFNQAALKKVDESESTTPQS